LKKVFGITNKVNKYLIDDNVDGSGNAAEKAAMPNFNWLCFTGGKPVCAAANSHSGPVRTTLTPQRRQHYMKTKSPFLRVFVHHLPQIWHFAHLAPPAEPRLNGKPSL
jgi:hypothetical protein